MEHLLGPRRFVLLLAVPLLTGAFLLGHSITSMNTQLTGIPGEFTAYHCDSRQSRSGGESWSCTGSFTADDKSFTISYTKMFPALDSEPTAPVAAKADDANATTVVVDDVTTWVLPAGSGAIILGIGIFMLYHRLRGRLRSRPSDRPSGRPRVR
ncbi:hypothetical protein ABT026_14855 [Streptomyces sp. NPDC002734]|uniref:hypothetical protein n=1 Tax=Streptomyces sp. NPDC002734 TaxID=3154426 RepID=UPI003322EB37